MWPSNANKDNKVFENELNKIFSHFGTAFLSDWITKTFNEKILTIIGANILLSLGNCENCINYIGVNPVLRKMKNISVISGFCKFYNDGVKKPHENVCGYFDPNKLIKGIIILRIKEHNTNKK